jgi:hypothetical protein
MWFVGKKNRCPYSGIIKENAGDAGTGLGADDAAGFPKQEIEYQVIQNRGQDSDHSEAQQDIPDSHRVSQRVKVRRGIAGFVYRPDRLLDDSKSHVLRGNQHFKLEFISGCPQLPDSV